MRNRLIYVCGHLISTYFQTFLYQNVNQSKCNTGMKHIIIIFLFDIQTSHNTLLPHLKNNNKCHEKQKNQVFLYIELRTLKPLHTQCHN